ncbi:ATP-binding cassette domain-containing protein [Pacificimonas sp. WHA3]|uniref:ATP-binding cassette domain-containing protein n=1 Tax=Pacificimonas pallii TaxID=2827236 RepID=A0ABS6SI46_9SPHN|nr:ATP-binding cassette domain-containing protein [Pacificimonas pallii]MBV7257596.1 ATP-binding cassette domain-containing protein [Pacificimonas pallii]
MVLEIRGLAHDYFSGTALSQIDLSLGKGQHSLLLGPSGSGKTTLINLICGLLTPQCGTIRICGEDMGAARGSEADDIRRRHVGIVFQTLRLVSALSLFDNLLLAQRLQRGGKDPATARALVAALGIEHRIKARPAELSQGEAQRAAIARALVGEPALLVADEPTSALDGENMRRVADLLLENAERTGTTLLIATHDERLKDVMPNVVELTPPGAQRRVA